MIPLSGTDPRPRTFRAPRRAVLPGYLAAIAALVALGGCAGTVRAPSSRARPTTAAGVDTAAPDTTGFAPEDIAERQALERTLDDAKDVERLHESVRQLAREPGATTGTARATWARDQLAEAGWTAELSTARALASRSTGLRRTHDRSRENASPRERVSRAPTVTSVIARLPGSDFADHEIVIGARFGRSAAAVLELARGLGKLAAGGWQPRRTLIFALWDDSTPGGVAASAWLATHTRDGATAPLAYLDAGPSPRTADLTIGAVASLRRLARALVAAHTTDRRPPRGITVTGPFGAADSGAFLDAGVPVLEIHGHAQLLGSAVLRLCDAPFPVSDHSIRVVSLLRTLNEIAAAATLLFDNNPPPVRVTRLALSDYRLAAENWEAVRDEWLAWVGSVPREAELAAGRQRARPGHRARRLTDVDDLRRRLRGAADALVATDRAFHDLAEPTEASACGSLLYCMDAVDDRAGDILSRLRVAVESRDRHVVVAESLRLAAAAREAAAQLRAASRALNAPAREQEP